MDYNNLETEYDYEATIEDFLNYAIDNLTQKEYKDLTDFIINFLGYDDEL